MLSITIKTPHSQIFTNQQHMGKCVSHPEGRENCPEMGKENRTGKISPANTDLARNFYAQKKTRQEAFSNEEIDLLNQGLSIDGKRFENDSNLPTDASKHQPSKTRLNRDLSKTCDGSNPRSIVSKRDDQDAYPFEKRPRRHSEVIDVSREYSLCSTELKMWLRKKSEN